MNTIEFDNWCCTWMFHSCTWRLCRVPLNAVKLGAANVDPRAANCEAICEYVLVKLKAEADDCQTAAPPVAPVAKGAMPAAGRTRMATASGGLASRSSTKPAGRLS